MFSLKKKKKKKKKKKIKLIYSFFWNTLVAFVLTLKDSYQSLEVTVRWIHIQLALLLAPTKSNANPSPTKEKVPKSVTFKHSLTNKNIDNSWF
jgi:hypothetical protein